MADPTPGPWTLRMIEPHETGDLVPEVVGSNGEVVCNAQTYYPHAVSLEDARLIAQAPEMLTLLREIEWQTFYDDDNGGEYDRCPVCLNDGARFHTSDCRLGNLLKRMEE